MRKARRFIKREKQVFLVVFLEYFRDFRKNKKTRLNTSLEMLNFDFLEKGLEIVSLPHFIHDFSRKMFLMLYSASK